MLYSEAIIYTNIFLEKFNLLGSFIHLISRFF